MLDRTESDALDWALRIYEDELDHTGATRRIKWCINKALLDHVTQLDVHARLFVLLGVKPKRGQETRHLVPLHLGEQLVQLRSPGDHVIHARLVAVTGNPQRIYDYINSRGDWGYRQDIWHTLPDGSKRLDHNGLELPFDTSAQYTCRVGEGGFAQRRPEWQTRLVNAWFKRNPADECNWRRRILYSALLYMLVSPIVFLIGFATAFFHSVLLARRGVNWSMLHPVDGNLEYLLSNAGGWSSLLTTKADGKSRWWGEWGAWLTPILHVIFIAGGAVLAHSLLVPEGWMTEGLGAVALGYFLVLGGLAALALAVVFCFFCVFLLGALASKTRDTVHKHQHARVQERLKVQRDPEAAQARQEAFAQSYQDFICINGSGRVEEPTFASNRAAYVRRRWNDVKLAVCRPFAE